MDTQVRITLYSSRIYAVLLFTLAIVSMLILSMLPVAAVWFWTGCVGVLASTSWLLHCDVLLKAQQSCVGFLCGKDRSISLALHNGEQLIGVVGGDTMVTPWLILLNVRVESHRRRSLVLFPDNMTGDEYRRLRVLLRHSEGVQS